MFAGLSGPVRTQPDILVFCTTADNPNYLSTTTLNTHSYSALRRSGSNSLSKHGQTGKKERDNDIAAYFRSSTQIKPRLENYYGTFGINIPVSVRFGSKSNKTVKGTSDLPIIGSIHLISNTVGNTTSPTPLAIKKAPFRNKSLWVKVLGLLPEDSEENAPETVPRKAEDKSCDAKGSTGSSTNSVALTGDFV